MASGLLDIDVKKLINGKWFAYPSIEFSGHTIRQILEDIAGQNIVIIVNQGMEGAFIVCGSDAVRETDYREKKNAMTSREILSFWQESPILDIVWPPFPSPALLSKMKGSASSESDSSFEEELVRIKAKHPVRSSAQRDLFCSERDLAARAESLFSQSAEKLRASDFDAAIMLLREVIALCPNHGRAWAALGHALEEIANEEEALNAYRKALHIENRMWKTQLALGKLLIRRNQRREAIEVLEFALKFSQRNESVKIVLANAYVLEGQEERAEELLGESRRAA